MTEKLADLDDEYVKKLCMDIPERFLGTAGNRQAADCGKHSRVSRTQCRRFDCSPQGEFAKEHLLIEHLSS